VVSGARAIRVDDLSRLAEEIVSGPRRGGLVRLSDRQDRSPTCRQKKRAQTRTRPKLVRAKTGRGVIGALIANAIVRRGCRRLKRDMQEEKQGRDGAFVAFDGD